MTSRAWTVEEMKFLYNNYNSKKMKIKELSLIMNRSQDSLRNRLSLIKSKPEILINEHSTNEELRANNLKKCRNCKTIKPLELFESKYSKKCNKCSDQDKQKKEKQEAKLLKKIQKKQLNEQKRLEKEIEQKERQKQKRLEKELRLEQHYQEIITREEQVGLKYKQLPINVTISNKYKVYYNPGKREKHIMGEVITMTDNFFTLKKENGIKESFLFKDIKLGDIEVKEVS